MRRALAVTMLLCGAAGACGDDAGGRGGPDASRATDAVLADAGTSMDAAPADAAAMDTTDATATDAVARDSAAQDGPSVDGAAAERAIDAAAPSDAAGPDAVADAAECQVGSPCNNGLCPPGLACMGGGGGSVCVPANRPICGGFANAQCPAGYLCLFFAQADYGPCLLVPESNCACSRPQAALICP